MKTEVEEGSSDKDIRQVFGHAVRDARMRKSWTQEMLAERINARGVSLTQTMVAKIERGARPTPVEEVAVIADVLGVPVGDLFTPGGTARELTGLRAAFQEMAVVTNRLDQAADEYEDARGILQDEIDKAASYVEEDGAALSRGEVQTVHRLLKVARQRAQPSAPQFVEEMSQRKKAAKDAYLIRHSGD